MLTENEKIHYNRQLILSEIGESGQEKLKNAHVLVIGAGGLGCPVLSYLTAAGVGHIGILDSDIVQKSNLHRQVLFGESQIGLAKVKAAEKRLKDLNPNVSFSKYNTWLSNKNALEIIQPYDLIVDATDNFPTRYLINDACVMLDKPFVLGSIDRFQGQVSVMNYTDSFGSKGPTYRCLFPEPPSPETAPNCEENGVVGVLPGIIGSIQANEVVKAIVGFGDIYSGKVLVVDTKSLNFYSMKVQRNSTAVNFALSLKNSIVDFNYGQFCEYQSYQDIKQISAESLLDKLSNEEIQLIDVRPSSQQDGIKSSIQIPYSSMENQIRNIRKDIPVIVYCSVGVTSLKAAKILQDQDFKNVFNLTGGLSSWNNYKNKLVKKVG